MTNQADKAYTEMLEKENAELREVIHLLQAELAKKEQDLHQHRFDSYYARTETREIEDQYLQAELNLCRSYYQELREANKQRELMEEVISRQGNALKHSEGFRKAADDYISQLEGEKEALKFSNFCLRNNIR